MLQNSLSHASVLVHFDPSKQLYIDLDASKEFGFGAVIFHVDQSLHQAAQSSQLQAPQHQPSRVAQISQQSHQLSDEKPISSSAPVPEPTGRETDRTVDISVEPLRKVTKAAQKWPARVSIQPIMFLSRALTSAERNYWPTQLELAGMVWVIKKTRHLIESSLTSTKIQTDHSAIVQLVKQKSITIRRRMMLLTWTLFMSKRWISFSKYD